MTDAFDLPSVLGPPVKLPSSRGRFESLWLGVTTDSNQLPSFAIEDQEQTLWCWASVGLSIRKFYQASTTLTQCALASAFPHGNPPRQVQCCGANQDTCNEQNSLKTVLTHLGHLASDDVDSARFELVKSEIDTRRPMCARIKPSGSDLGHFVVLSGYKAVSNRQYVTVHDPANNGAGSNVRADMPLQEFTSAYWGGPSEWTHHYLTRA